MTYSSMANFQGEGSLDITPKEDKSYQNYSYTPLEEEFVAIADPSVDDKVSEEQQRAEEFTGLGAKPSTSEPVINTDNNDDDEPTSYLDSVKTNLLNAASGSVKRVKEFLSSGPAEPDNDYNLVYDEYDTLYMPQDLKAKNVPIGPKDVLTNYVPYVNTYSITKTNPVITQESLIDPRGEFPYTDDYRERIQNILDDDAIKRTSAELGISSQRALEMYLNSEPSTAVQDYINLNLGASLRPSEPAFQSYEVADSTGGFDSLMGLDSWMKSTEQGLEGAFSGEPMFKYTSPVKDEVILKKDIDVTEYNLETSRKGTLTDLKNGIKSTLNANKIKSPTSSITPEDNSTQVEGLGSFLLDVDPKIRRRGFGVDFNTRIGNFKTNADIEGNVDLEFIWDNGTVKWGSDGTASFEFNIDF